MTEENIKTFWDRVNIFGPPPKESPELGSCWIWSGYGVTCGMFTPTGSRYPQQAYRISFELLQGKIPKGMHLHHKCKNKWCVNPNHLELVTPMSHPDVHPTVLRNRTHCPRGHEFTEENTNLTWNDRGIVYRQCRACKKADNRRYYEQKNGTAH